MVQSWLQVHKHTLRYIKIGAICGYYGAGRGRPFDAKEFSNLEELRISRFNMSRALDEDVDLILGPKLRKFQLDYVDLSEETRTNVSDCGEKEEKWLRCLAQVAIARGHCLQVIYVDFCTLDFGNEFEGYPWDGLDRLRAEFQSPGLRVEHSGYSYTRDEWMILLRAEREGGSRRILRLRRAGDI